MRLCGSKYVVRVGVGRIEWKGSAWGTEDERQRMTGCYFGVESGVYNWQWLSPFPSHSLLIVELKG